MMSSKVIVASLMVLLAFFAASEGRSLGMELHCRCIHTESKPIGRYIEKIELIPSNSHCGVTEIIATLKNSGKEVCLNPEAQWVKRVIKTIMANKKR